MRTKPAPLRVAIIGLGRSGRYHLERLSLRSDLVPHAVCDHDPAARAAVAHFGCLAYDDWRACLDDPQIDLVLIATPPAGHAGQAAAALEAGKHVLVESPLALSADDAAGLCVFAEGCRRMLAVVDLRWEDDFCTAERAVRSGMLGRLNALELLISDYAAPQRIPAEGFAKSSSANGVGVLLRFGVQYLDQLLALADDRPLSVYGWTAPADGESADAFLAVVRFAGGAVGRVEINHRARAPQHSGWILRGDEGDYHQFRRYTRTPAGEIVDERLERRPGQRDAVYTNVLEHLGKGAPLAGAARAAWRALLLSEAVGESARSGQAVPIDPIGWAR